ncbi:MAG: AtpZ/AtpI family protein [Nitrospirota bacterium]
MKEEDKKFIRRMLVLSTVGFTIVIATVIGLAIGLYLDNLFGTSPWLALLFFLLGLIAGFRNLVRMFKKTQQ